MGPLGKWLSGVKEQNCSWQFFIAEELSIHMCEKSGKGGRRPACVLVKQKYYSRGSKDMYAGRNVGTLPGCVRMASRKLRKGYNWILQRMGKIKRRASTRMLVRKGKWKKMYPNDTKLSDALKGRQVIQKDLDRLER